MESLEKRTQLRPYEAVVMMHPDASEDDQKALFKKNSSIIKDFKGTLNHVDTWGKRSLANHIEGLKKAIYFHATFEAEPSAVAELERTMRINDKVLRFMHTRLPDGTNLVDFVEGFKKALADSALREREREAKFQARKAAMRGGGGGGRGRRDDFGGDEGGDEGGGGRGGRGGGRRDFGGGDDEGGEA
jgi:small subunit ribosomal protein S6